MIDRSHVRAGALFDARRQPYDESGLGGDRTCCYRFIHRRRAYVIAADDGVGVSTTGGLTGFAMRCGFATGSAGVLSVALRSVMCSAVIVTGTAGSGDLLYAGR
ncbi:hypothetical protein TPB0596_43220 [Tsukamurella pulmonis]|nr:hypothetical protein TPB0596_43220 [Tsukamurella pulmonis]